jgi:hypothetical protein
MYSPLNSADYRTLTSGLIAINPRNMGGESADRRGHLNRAISTRKWLTVRLVKRRRRWAFCFTRSPIGILTILVSWRFPTLR